MTDLYKQYKEFGITENVFGFCENVLDSLEDRFKAIDKTAEYNQLKTWR